MKNITCLYCKNTLDIYYYKEHIKTKYHLRNFYKEMERKKEIKDLEAKVLDLKFNEEQIKQFTEYLDMKSNGRGRNKDEKLIYKLQQILKIYPKPNTSQSYYKRNKLLYLNKSKKGTEYYEKIKEDIKNTPATIKIKRGRFNFFGEEIDESGNIIKK